MKLTQHFFEALRTRMENILRSLSGNRKAYIIYGNTIATDVKNQVVLEPRDRILPGINCSLVELYLFYKACTAHEGGHIRFTSKKAWDEAARRGPAFQHLTNIIEDGRIEAAVGQELPGAGRWIKFINQYIFNHRKDYGEGIQEFLGGLCAYSVCGKLPLLSPETLRLVKLAAPYVDIGKAAPTTEKVLEVVEEILNIPDVKNLFDSIPPPPMDEQKGTNSPQKTTPSQETKERANQAQKVVLARRKAKEGEQSGTSKKSGETEESSEDPEATSKEENSGKSEESSKEENSGESEEFSEENSGESEETSEENPGESEETSEEESGETSKAPEETGSASEENSEEEASEESEETPEENSGEESSGESEESSEEKSEETSEESEENPEEAEGKSQPPEEENPEENPEDPEEDFFSNEYLEEDFTELIISSEVEIQGVSQEAREMEEAGKTVTVNTGEIHRCVSLEIITPAPGHRYDALKKKNEKITKQLIEEIRVALETKKSYDIRGLNRGRLSASSLYKLAIPDPNVFAKKKAPGDIPELALCLMMDLSGSMDNVQPIKGGAIRRIEAAQNAACVISETCHDLKIAHKVIGFNARNRTDIVYHYNIVDWEEADSSRISSVYPDYFNRDGYSIRMGAQELLNRREERKLLLVLSDGVPQVGGTYPNSVGIVDTREAAIEIKKQGIEVISLFFGEPDQIKTFRYMYSNPVFVDDINFLPIRLGEVFKRVLLN